MWPIHCFSSRKVTVGLSCMVPCPLLDAIALASAQSPAAMVFDSGSIISFGRSYRSQRESLPFSMRMLLPSLRETSCPLSVMVKRASPASARLLAPAKSRGTRLSSSPAR